MLFLSLLIIQLRGLTETITETETETETETTTGTEQTETNETNEAMDKLINSVLDKFCANSTNPICQAVSSQEVTDYVIYISGGLITAILSCLSYVGCKINSIETMTRQALTPQQENNEENKKETEKETETKATNDQLEEDEPVSEMLADDEGIDREYQLEDLEDIKEFRIV